MSPRTRLLSASSLLASLSLSQIPLQPPLLTQDEDALSTVGLMASPDRGLGSGQAGAGARRGEEAAGDGETDGAGILRYRSRSQTWLIRIYIFAAHNFWIMTHMQPPLKLPTDL